MADTFTQGLVEQGEKRGIEKEKRNLIIRMFKHGLSDEDISTYVDVPLATVREIKNFCVENGI